MTGTWLVVANDWWRLAEPVPRYDAGQCEATQCSMEGIMGFYESLGVRTVINAAGALTRLGGNRVSLDVLDAMVDAAASNVMMDELQAHAGAVIADDHRTGVCLELIHHHIGCSRVDHRIEHIQGHAVATEPGQRTRRVDHRPHTERFVESHYSLHRALRRFTLTGIIAWNWLGEAPPVICNNQPRACHAVTLSQACCHLPRTVVTLSAANGSPREAHGSVAGVWRPWRDFALRATASPGDSSLRSEGRWGWLGVRQYACDTPLSTVSQGQCHAEQGRMAASKHLDRAWSHHTDKMHITICPSGVA